MKKIYTKKGDKGETSLCCGNKLPKDHIRLEALGAIDELNAVLGIIRASYYNPEISRIIKNIQDNLFIIGANIAFCSDKNQKIPKFPKQETEKAEKLIDSITKNLPPLKNFIFPGESTIGSYFSFARAICRRAERRVVSLNRKEKIAPDISAYLNRLSDLIFTLERASYKKKKVKERRWIA